MKVTKSINVTTVFSQNVVYRGYTKCTQSLSAWRYKKGLVGDNAMNYKNESDKHVDLTYLCIDKSSRRDKSICGEPLS